jgi:hypothetical protein
MLTLLITGVVSLVVTGFAISQVYNNCIKSGYRLQVVQLVVVLLFTGVLGGYVVGVYSGQYDLLKNKAAHFKPVIISKMVTNPRESGILKSDTTYSATLDRLPILYPQRTGYQKSVPLEGDTLFVHAHFIYF